MNAKKINVKFNKGKMQITRRAEIVWRFDVPEAEATQEFLNALVVGIRQDVVKELGDSTEIMGKWL